MKQLVLGVVIFAAGMVAGHVAWPPHASPPADAPEPIVAAPAAYVCPMHPDVVAHEAGTCPICGMALVQARQEAHDHAAMQEEMTGAHPAVRVTPEVMHNLGVKTVAVQRASLVRRIETPGFVQQIQPGKPRRVMAPFSATVAEVKVAADDSVDKGAVLMVLESPALLAAEQAHLAVLAQESLSVDTAGSAPAALTLVESRRQLQQLGLSLADIRQLESSGEAAARLTLVAPQPSRVSELSLAAGDHVADGELLFEIIPMARATVLANAFQRDAAWIQTGQQVEVRLPHVSGQNWSGIVNQGAVSLDPTSQNIGVRLSFSAPDHLLKSAMYVVATIFGETREHVLAVPREALIRTGTEERVVRALGGGRFQPVIVHTGIETDGQVEILHGLDEGDEVVTSAQFLIDSESSLQAGFQRMSGGGD